MRCDTGKIDIQTLFSISLRIFRENMKLLVSVVVLLSVPYYIWLVCGGWEEAGWFASNAVLDGNGRGVLEVFRGILFVIMMIPLFFLPPAVVSGVVRIYSGSSSSVLEVLKLCIQRWKILAKTILLLFPIYIIAVALLVVFIFTMYDVALNLNMGMNVITILVGSGVLLAGAVWLVLRFLLVLPVAIVENVGGFQAFSRSFAIMKDNTNAGLIVLAVYAAMVILSAFATDIFPFFRVGVVVSEVTDIIATVGLGIASTVLYFSSRCTHERFDPELLAEDVGQ